MQKWMLFSIYSHLFYIWFHFSNASSLYSSFGSIHLSSVWKEKSHEMFSFLFSGWKKIRLNYLHTLRTWTFEDKYSYGDMTSNCGGPQNIVIRRFVKMRLAALVQDMQAGNTSGCQYTPSRQLVSLDKDRVSKLSHFCLVDDSLTAIYALELQLDFSRLCGTFIIFNFFSQSFIYSYMFADP